MLNPFVFEEILKMEQNIRDDQLARQAALREQMPRRASGDSLAGLRRGLARLLLVLADRLDPRAVVSVPHVATRPALNGTLHHA
jgi:hypothetical protein